MNKYKLDYHISRAISQDQHAIIPLIDDHPSCSQSISEAVVCLRSKGENPKNRGFSRALEISMPFDAYTCPLAQYYCFALAGPGRISRCRVRLCVASLRGGLVSTYRFRKIMLRRVQILIVWRYFCFSAQISKCHTTCRSCACRSIVL